MDHSQTDAPVPQPPVPCAATFKILLIGDACVGKTSLLCRYVDGEFRHNYVTTVGVDYKNKVIEMDCTRIKLQIWDTAGQERFRTLTNAYYRGAQGVIIMYDITNRTSFAHVTEWVKSARQHGSVDIQIIVVGHKSDKEDQRSVEAREGEMLAENFDAEFLEASSLTGHNCEKIFLLIAESIKSAKELAGTEPSGITRNLSHDGRLSDVKQRRNCCTN